MKSIQFRDGGVEVDTGRRQYRVTDFSKVCATHEKLVERRTRARSEESHRIYTATIDLLATARESLAAEHVFVRFQTDTPWL